MIVSALLCVPLVFVVSIALASDQTVNTNTFSILPREFHWENFLRVFDTTLPMGRFLVNSIIISAGAVAGQVLSSGLIGYAFARLRAPGKNALFMVVIATMMIPAQITMIPQFILFKDLGWVNTFLPLIVPNFFSNAFNVFLMRQFVSRLPREVDEAAMVDGLGFFGVYRRIMLPMLAPALIAIGIFTLTATWGDFMGPLIYLNDESKMPLALGVQYITSTSQAMQAPPWNLVMVGSILLTLPMIAGVLPRPAVPLRIGHHRRKRGDQVTVQTAVGSGVELDATGIRLGGEPRLLLCASLFYFRLPREEWRDRLAQVRTSGYTCVDVYFPWNFHETAPGEWSFEGRRDLAAFLDLAHAEGLYVIARPGPYICSEWDGGALPAWLGLDPQLRVRQHEPRFLAQGGRWLDQVLPILAERQYPDGGPVIMVQLENELDFFDCADRAGYLTALRDQVLGHGITVPLIACAGQGDLAGATGDVAGVVPACNFYPDDDSPDIEAEVRHYADLLAARGLPLLVTETNRGHRTLRRLLACGASLLGPYLQSAGWNFGYTPSSGNWGDAGQPDEPLLRLRWLRLLDRRRTSGYAEAQVLSQVLAALGSRLARATPGTPGIDITADFPRQVAARRAGTRRRRPTARAAEPRHRTGNRCPVRSVGGSRAGHRRRPDLPAAPDRVALDADWGAALTLTLASADLVATASGPGTLALAFCSDTPVTVILDGLDAVRTNGSACRIDGDPVVGNRATVILPPARRPSAGWSPARIVRAAR